MPFASHHFAASLTNRVRQAPANRPVRVGDPVCFLVQLSPMEVGHDVGRAVYRPENLTWAPVRHVYADGTYIDPTSQCDVYRSFPAGTPADDVVAAVLAHNAAVLADYRARIPEGRGHGRYRASFLASEFGSIDLEENRYCGMRETLRRLEERVARTDAAALLARLAGMEDAARPQPVHAMGDVVSVTLRDEGEELGRFDDRVVGIGLARDGGVLYHFEDAEDVPEADVGPAVGHGDKAAVLAERQRRETRRSSDYWRGVLDLFG